MKITSIQLFWMILIMSLGMTLVMTLTPSLQAAQQDVWLSVLVAGGFAVLITLFVTKVANLYPHHSFVEYCQIILGKWVGTIVVILYLVQWYTIIPIVLHQFSDLLQVTYLHLTPKEAIILVMVALIVYVTYAGGIEAIGRCSEFLGPIILIMVILVLVASANNVVWRNLLPVYVDSGPTGILMGATTPAGYLGHTVEYMVLASFLYQPQKGPRYAYAAIITATIFVTISMMMAILTLGINLPPQMWYPFFEMTKKISIFGFIENLDAIPIVIWIASVFIKLAIFMFISSYGTAQFLHVKNWRIMVWFIAPVVFVFSLIPQNVTEATTNYLLNYWMPIVLTLNMFGFPLLLLIVGTIRKKMNQSGKAVNQE